MARTPTVRIQSDGDGRTTVITTASGEPIPDIYSASVTLEAGNVNVITLVLTGTILDIHADVGSATFLCPMCESQINHLCGE